MIIEPLSLEKLTRYERLFNLCFPKSNLNANYLDWLYYKNPLGNAVGFDAIIEGEIVGHYACIPTNIDGEKGLLSLNTATHPNHRSKGIYQNLANLTYDTWREEFNFVIGVANSQSASAFIRKLGFDEVGKLNLRYGSLSRPTNGVKTWNIDEVVWRASSPRKNFKVKELKNGTFEMSSRPSGFPFKIRSLINLDTQTATENQNKYEIGLTVDWVKNRNSVLHLPEKFKPSPLVLIFKKLSGTDINLNSWSFPDFDAF